ncbi:MAG: response regulator transcription factor [Treponema sp.]|nr:response regulator transcription factor [Treponema sp.]
MKILIVDDEEPIRELIKYNVEKDGFTSVCAENGIDAINLARKENPDIIVLDLLMPDMSGLDVCRILKNDNNTYSIPIIMVTAKTEDSDIVLGLEIGADDYITKPFSPKILLARIKSVLRRINMRETNDGSTNGEISVKNLKINNKKHQVSVNGNVVELSMTEYDILSLLASHPGQVFSRQQIINEVKGSSYPVTERSIDVQIVNIRHKIGESSFDTLIETIRGIGYRLSE